MTPLAELLDQRCGAGNGADLWQQLSVEALFSVPCFVTVAFLYAIAGHRCNELVASHPDVSMNFPARKRYADLPEGTEPGDRVVVIRIDQSPIDIEDCGRGVGALHHRTGNASVFDLPGDGLGLQLRMFAVIRSSSDWFSSALPT
jgi:hypothetical protein